MAQVKDVRLQQRARLILALLCPVAWLYTGWHLAVEAHHEHAKSARGAVDDHDHGHHDAVRHHDDDRNDDHAPAEEGHHHDDHLIPDSLRPDHGPAFAIDLEPSDVVLEELAATPAPVAAPSEDVPPATDPPIESRRPRAPPVG